MCAYVYIKCETLQWTNICKNVNAKIFQSHKVMSSQEFIFIFFQFCAFGKFDDSSKKLSIFPRIYTLKKPKFPENKITDVLLSIYHI
jgi:hypothetical protein